MCLCLTHLPWCRLLCISQQSSQFVIQVTQQLRSQHFIHIHECVWDIHSEGQMCTDRHFRGTESRNLIRWSVYKTGFALSAVSSVRVYLRNTCSFVDQSSCQWVISETLRPSPKHLHITAVAQMGLYNKLRQIHAYKCANTKANKHTCRFGTALFHLRTRMHTPDQRGTGLCAAGHPPAGNTLACRPADIRPVCLTQMTWSHPEKKEIKKNQIDGLLHKMTEILPRYLSDSHKVHKKTRTDFG